MTRGARPHCGENPGRVEAGGKLLVQAGGIGGKMQQSRAGSFIAGNPRGKDSGG